MPQHTCAKIGYATADEAMRAARNTLTRLGNKKQERGKVSPYKCDCCGLYHWGHWGKNKSTPKRKTKRLRLADT